MDLSFTGQERSSFLFRWGGSSESGARFLRNLWQSWVSFDRSTLDCPRFSVMRISAVTRSISFNWKRPTTVSPGADDSPLTEDSPLARSNFRGGWYASRK